MVRRYRAKVAFPLVENCILCKLGGVDGDGLYDVSDFTVIWDTDNVGICILLPFAKKQSTLASPR
jgi:hypothetical protein